LEELDARLHLAPTFRRRLTELPGALHMPYWVDDPDFDLEYHVRHIALPEPGDWRQLCIQVARIHARQLDLRRPPWEITVIEGLDSVAGVPKGAFALLVKLHPWGGGGASWSAVSRPLSPGAPSPRLHPRHDSTMRCHRTASSRPASMIWPISSGSKLACRGRRSTMSRWPTSGVRFVNISVATVSCPTR